MGDLGRKAVAVLELLDLRYSASESQLPREQKIAVGHVEGLARMPAGRNWKDPLVLKVIVQPERPQILDLGRLHSDQQLIEIPRHNVRYSRLGIISRRGAHLRGASARNQPLLL